MFNVHVYILIIEETISILRKKDISKKTIWGDMIKNSEQRMINSTKAIKECYSIRVTHALSTS